MNQPRDRAPDLTTEFFENQHNFPLEELAKYAGKHIAWGLDGKTILASANTGEELEETLAKKGIPSGHAVRSYVDPPDLVVMGGYWVED